MFRAHIRATIMGARRFERYFEYDSGSGVRGLDADDSYVHVITRCFGCLHGADGKQIGEAGIHKCAEEKKRRKIKRTKTKLIYHTRR